jgi:acetyl-CoA carboxylase biotin carboxylase subunit
MSVFESVLVANRGEIACRVMRTCRRLGIRTIAVHSDADATARHVREAEEAVLIGGARPAESYLDGGRIIRAALAARAAAVHPGYGFLSEDANFARAVTAAGLAWVGPAPETIEAMGDKVRARNRVAPAGVPVSAGTDEPLRDIERALAHARVLGFPVIVKPSGGGGGIGMSVAEDEAQLAKAFAAAQRRAASAFGDAGLLLERYFRRARHVEVQVLGLADGTVLVLGERDCSVQRRHQKVVEETPSPGVTPELRRRLMESAVRVARSVDYRGAGTVEFLVDTVAAEHVFLEMNTRLQVEHPVTELVTGVDLVEQQLRIAAGQSPSFASVAPGGHAIELRVYAEDPERFLPSPGTIAAWTEPSGEHVRVDSGYAAGDVVSPFYDPLLAKLCVWGRDRAEALATARDAVAGFRVEGVATTLPFHARLLAHPGFVAGDYTTQLVAELRQAA